MLEHQHDVCRENANSINKHTGTPESNILAVGLVRVLLRKHPEGDEENEASVREGIDEPFDEEPGGEGSALDTQSVKQRIPEEIAFQLSPGQIHLHVNILLVLEVVDCVPQNRERGHSDIVHLVDQLLVQWLAGESGVEAEVELRHHIQEVLIEIVKHEQGVTSIGLATMEEEERLQELELADGKVSTSGGLLSFLSEDTNTDVGLQDHTDIVGSVTDRKCGLFWEPFLDEVDDISFLLW